MRLHHFGLSVDPGLWGQTVEVLIYDDVVRIERADHLLASYLCVYDPRQRRITAVDAQGRQIPPGAGGAVHVIHSGARTLGVAHAALPSGAKGPAAAGRSATKPLRSFAQ
ncbi:MAG: hypothetical protein ACRERE_22545 [Candidatus Entotheonellia bacterium]